MIKFIHKEGKGILAGLFIVLLLLNILVYFSAGGAGLLFKILAATSILFYAFNLWFFRQPNRPVTPDENLIIAPADGKIVAIEEVFEPEYFKDKRLQVSIFMSPLNVHVNRYPVSGTVKYMKYHKGAYLVAWHPKSSELNERTSVVIENHHGEILLRQIAGALARRIVYYPNEGDKVIQGHDLGFIKFGSRVDLFLPVDAFDLQISLNQKVLGNQTVIATKKK
jgi:phosphatidylserine decarboxylase